MTFVEVIWRLESLKTAAALAAEKRCSLGGGDEVMQKSLIEASFTRIHIHNLRKMGIIVSCSNYSRYTVNAFRLNLNLIDGNLS